MADTPTAPAARRRRKRFAQWPERGDALGSARRFVKRGGERLRRALRRARRSAG